MPEKRDMNLNEARAFFDSHCKKRKINVGFVDHGIGLFMLTDCNDVENIIIERGLNLSEWLPLAFELIKQPFPTRTTKPEARIFDFELADILDAEFLEGELTINKTSGESREKQTREKLPIKAAFPVTIQPETIQENEMNNNAKTNEITFQKADKESAMNLIEAEQLMKDIAIDCQYESFVIYGLFFLLTSIEALIEANEITRVKDIINSCQHALYADSPNIDAGCERLAETIHLVYRKADFAEMSQITTSDLFINAESLAFQKGEDENPGTNHIPSQTDAPTISDIPHSKPPKTKSKTKGKPE